MGGAGTVSDSRSSKCGHFTLCFVVISSKTGECEGVCKDYFCFVRVDVIVRVQGYMCVMHIHIT